MRRLVLALAMAAVLVGCRKPEETEPAPKAVAPPPPAPAPVETAAPQPERNFDPQIVEEVKTYFNTKSKLAGKVVMTEVLQLRMDVVNDTCKVAHVQFAYEPATSGRVGPGVDRGVRFVTHEDKKGHTDSRTFEYNKDAKGWRIRSMGEEQSASFGDDLAGWSDSQAVEDVVKFYNTKGVWAGKFRLGAVVRYRVDRITSTTKLAYIKYLYIPLPGNPRETGYDKRTYRFEKRGGRWEVTWMGDYMSAAEGLKR